MKGCKCGGEGTIEKNGKLYECVCAMLKRVASAMPPYIRKADVNRQHVLLPLTGMVKKSVFILSSWADAKAVIKVAMIKNPNIGFRITSDREIRDVYVGSTSRAAKGNEEEGVFNSLQDLMDPPGLVVVRLNELAYKNKAAPGALEEAISYRTDRDKPTWALSDTARPFGMGSYAYSENVMELLLTAFTKVSVGPFTQSEVSPAPAKSFLTPDPVEPGPAEKAPVRKPRPVPREPPREEAEADDPLALYRSGNSPKKNFRKG